MAVNVAKSYAPELPGPPDPSNTTSIIDYEKTYNIPAFGKDWLNNDRVKELICKGTIDPAFYEIYTASQRTNMNAKLDELVTNYIGYIDSQIKTFVRHYKMFNDEPPERHKSLICDLCNAACNIICEPSIGTLSSQPSFNNFTREFYQTPANEFITKFKITENKSDNEFTPAHDRKRKNSNTEFTVKTQNRFSVLEDNNSPHTENMIVDQVAEENTSDLHPFFIEIDQNWNSLAEKLKEKSKGKIILKMSGPHLKALTKNSDDFRAIQRYLDDNNLKYTTLNPSNERPRKICIRGIPVYTSPDLIIKALFDKGYTATRVAMLKNRKNGAPMPLYMANILPKDKFEEIYDIDELLDINIKIERFKSNNIKQCYRCQGYNHASEVCKLSPKCVKCAGEHLTPNCPTTGRITPKCANCGMDHPASYRGCAKNPANIKRKRNNPTNKPHHPTQHNSNDSKSNHEILEIFKNYNYTKKCTTNTKSDIQTVNNTKNRFSEDFPPLINEKTENQEKNTENVTPSTNVSENTTQMVKSDMQEIFEVFQDIKEFVQIGKLLKSIRNIASLIKKNSNPMEKLMIILNEFDSLANELNLSFND